MTLTPNEIAWIRGEFPKQPPEVKEAIKLTDEELGFSYFDTDAIREERRLRVAREEYFKKRE